MKKLFIAAYVTETNTWSPVPTGMNAGVRISPRCMRMTPVRAAPSVAWISKSKRVMASRLAVKRRLEQWGS